MWWGRGDHGGLWNCLECRLLSHVCNNSASIALRKMGGGCNCTVQLRFLIGDYCMRFGIFDFFDFRFWIWIVVVGVVILWFILYLLFFAIYDVMCSEYRQYYTVAAL